MTALISCSHVTACLCLSQLAADGAWDCLARVHVGEETGWVGFDLLHLETGAGVGTVGHETGGEWSGHAAKGVSLVTLADWVGERESRRSVLAFGSFVDVCGRLCWRLVIALEADELDAPADQVEVRVDAKVIVAGAAWQTSSKGWVGGAVNDLIRSSDDVVGGGKVEWSWHAGTTVWCWV